jgi:RNA polymerase sigma factor (sigma-70 family)
MTTSNAADEPSTASEGEARHQPVFATTHWSVVVNASRADTTQASEALASLYKTYWYPLYAYVRRRGYSAHDAEDLTQGLFVSLLENQSLSNADPKLGRFRSFILGAMNHFLSSQQAKRRTQKRGDGQANLSLDLALAEQRFDLEPTDHSSPDKAFDRAWANALLTAVLKALEAEYQREDKDGLFQALKETLAGARESQPYAQLAVQLDLSEGAVRVAVHRLRKRYRDLLQAEIARTVSSSAEARAELDHLFRVMGGG